MSALDQILTIPVVKCEHRALCAEAQAELAEMRAEVTNLRRVLAGSTEQAVEMIYTAVEAESEVETRRARVAELERRQAEETAEFNAGFDAFQRGEPVTVEPVSTPYDVWVMGWAWAQYQKQVTA